MSFWSLTGIVLVSVIVFSFSVFVYRKKVLLPGRRIKALEESLSRAAAINVAGDSHESIKVSDVINESSPINSIPPWKQSRKKPFHNGPFAHELSDKEWKHVHEFYPQAIEKITSHKIRVEANLSAVEESDRRIRRRITAYRKAAEETRSIGSSIDFHGINEPTDPEVPEPVLDHDNDSNTLSLYPEKYSPSWKKMKREKMRKEVEMYIENQDKQLEAEWKENRKNDSHSSDSDF